MVTHKGGCHCGRVRFEVDAPARIEVFNTGTARHLFCSVCGIKSFYVPRSNPDGWTAGTGKRATGGPR